MCNHVQLQPLFGMLITHRHQRIKQFIKSLFNFSSISVSNKLSDNRFTNIQFWYKHSRRIN